MKLSMKQNCDYKLNITGTTSILDRIFEFNYSIKNNSLELKLTGEIEFPKNKLSSIYKFNDFKEKYIFAHDDMNFFIFTTNLDYNAFLSYGKDENFRILVTIISVFIYSKKSLNEKKKTYISFLGGDINYIFSPMISVKSEFVSDSLYYGNKKHVYAQKPRKDYELKLPVSDNITLSFSVDNSKTSEYLRYLDVYNSCIDIYVEKTQTALELVNYIETMLHIASVLLVHKNIFISEIQGILTIDNLSYDFEYVTSQERSSIKKNESLNLISIINYIPELFNFFIISKNRFNFLKDESSYDYSDVVLMFSHFEALCKNSNLSKKIVKTKKDDIDTIKSYAILELEKLENISSEIQDDLINYLKKKNVFLSDKIRYIITHSEILKLVIKESGYELDKYISLLVSSRNSISHGRIHQVNLFKLKPNLIIYLIYRTLAYSFKDQSLNNDEFIKSVFQIIEFEDDQCTYLYF